MKNFMTFSEKLWEPIFSLVFLLSRSCLAAHENEFLVFPSQCKPDPATTLERVGCAVQSPDSVSPWLGASLLLSPRPRAVNSFLSLCLSIPTWKIQTRIAPTSQTAMGMTRLHVCSALSSTPQVSSAQSLSHVRLRHFMDCSTPGLPVHHQLPEFTETQVHRVGDAIQPSRPLSSLLLLPSTW